MEKKMANRIGKHIQEPIKIKTTTKTIEKPKKKKNFHWIDKHIYEPVCEISEHTDRQQAGLIAYKL